MNVKGFRVKLQGEGKVDPPGAPLRDASDNITERDAPTTKKVG